jgi:hypothetical protein
MIRVIHPCPRRRRRRIYVRGTMFTARQVLTYDLEVLTCLALRKVRGRFEPRQNLNGAVYSDPDIASRAIEVLMQRVIWSGVHRAVSPFLFIRHFVRKREKEELRDPVLVIDPFYHPGPHPRADPKRLAFDLRCSLKLHREVTRAARKIIAASPFAAKKHLLVLRAVPDSVPGLLKGHDFLKNRPKLRN